MGTNGMQIDWSKNIKEWLKKSILVVSKNGSFAWEGRPRSEDAEDQEARRRLREGWYR
jgi:hypothetical protein